jgi:hypothetical protein
MSNPLIEVWLGGIRDNCNARIKVDSMQYHPPTFLSSLLKQPVQPSWW